MIPDDGTLTEAGLAPSGRGRVLLIACGALAREILDLKAVNGWDHLDLTCLPAILHNFPDRITGAVEEAVAKNRDAYDEVFVVYADCGTGGLLQAKCAELGVGMVEGPHCYSFFEGNAVFAARDEMTAFYLTDFLVRQFDAFVWKPLGLDGTRSCEAPISGITPSWSIRRRPMIPTLMSARVTARRGWGWTMSGASRAMAT
jgi:Protein of unknown function (DUF1638)